MKIIRTIAAEDCPNGIDCARVYELDNGEILVRGYRVADSETLAELGELPANETAVIIPRDVYEEARK